MRPYVWVWCPNLSGPSPPPPFLPGKAAVMTPLAATTTGSVSSVPHLLLQVRGGVKPAGKASAGAAGKKVAAGSGAAGKSKAKPSPPVQIIEDDEDDEEEEDDDEEWDEEEGEGDYDEEEEEYEEEEQDVRRGGRGSSGSSKKRPNDWHYADRRRRLAARKGSSYGMAGLFKGAAKLTSNSVGKVAGLFQPNKYVGLREVLGVWKVKQKIALPGGELERCEATVDIRKDGSVVTFFEGKELVSEFLFKERQWPRACIIEFEARAFQGPYDREPQLKFYKGYVRRSLMNAGVVRLEGKIYEVQGTFFWRQKKQVGKFRAVKR